MKIAKISCLILLFALGLSAQQNMGDAMEQRLSFITLGVKDLSKSAEFYQKQFGWIPLEMSNDDILFFKLNGMMLSLYPWDKLAEDAGVDSSGSGYRGFTLCYLTRSEAEVDRIIEKMREADVPVIKEPQKVFWGGYSSYISDPDGNLWEIAFNPYAIPEENKD